MKKVEIYSSTGSLIIEQTIIERFQALTETENCCTVYDGDRIVAIVPSSMLIIIKEIE